MSESSAAWACRRCGAELAADGRCSRWKEGCQGGRGEVIPEASAAEKLAEMVALIQRYGEGKVSLETVRFNLSALTTRLAEAQQDLRIARADAESVKKAVVYEYERAEAAETRLAEVERVVRINCTEEELSRYETTAGKVLHAFGVVRGQGAESAEQLLSEMAAHADDHAQDETYDHMVEAGDHGCATCREFKAKYDARVAEAR